VLSLSGLSARRSGNLVFGGGGAARRPVATEGDVTGRKRPQLVEKRRPARCVAMGSYSTGVRQEHRPNIFLRDGEPFKSNGFGGLKGGRLMGADLERPGWWSKKMIDSGESK